MGALSSRPQPVVVKGVSTRLKSPPGEVGVRTCVTTSMSTKGGKPVCAVASRARMRAACKDACDFACEVAARAEVNWWRRRRIAVECAETCTPSCDQPPRVARSSFEVTVR